MSYYHLLGLSREPFSTSPDPAFFYLSRAHRAAFFRLRVAVELRRGLSLVAGDIGTGKTTLARRLSQIFYEDTRLDFHAILNPMHHEDGEFLKTLLETFHIEASNGARPLLFQKGPGPFCLSSIDALHAIEKYLFHKAVEEQKTVVLLIDEAQQLSRASLEILRALLNYETNEHKLLQVILMGQMELIAKLVEVPNFWDRLSLKLKIPPLDESQTREMIRYRLEQADYRGRWPLFNDEALRLIYRETGGYPRKITMLCHEALEHLIMLDKPQVDGKLVRALSRHEEELLVG